MNQSAGFHTRGGALARLPLATLFHVFGVFWLCSVAAVGSMVAQTRDYPKEIRGYKVERTVVEMKGTKPSKTTPTQNQTTADVNNSPGTQTSSPASSTPPVNQLITFGQPSVARITPLGITFEVPIVVAPIKQSGHVDFLLFEDMQVNEHSIEIDEYHRAFDLPTKKPLTLREPLRFYIYLPVAVLAAADEANNSKDTWPITGRVYVCGKYKKFLLSFKRCVPVELDLTMRNPVKEK